MFGYIVANKPELKVKELEVYQGYYCGICHALKQRHGQLSRLSLNFDLTFVALLLSSLDLKDAQNDRKRCLLHPMSKHLIYQDDYINYAADMTILLAYEKCRDDWQDERRWSSRFYQQVLTPQYHRVQEQYPEKVQTIQQYLGMILDLEKANSQDIDRLAGLFGEIMAQILTFQNEPWQPQLHALGMYLGKFIYLMDAYDDLESDQAKQQFNVLVERSKDPLFESWIVDILSLQMAKACEALEELPIVDNEGILKNILYSGIWSKYQAKQSQKEDK